MNKVILALATLGALASAYTYTVEKEGDFYKTLYSTTPGDTIVVACDLAQGIVIDQGGKKGSPVMIIAKGYRSMCSSSSRDQVVISASYVVLKGFKASCSTLKVTGNGVQLEDLAGDLETYTYTVSGNENQLTNVTGFKVELKGDKNVLKSSKARMVNVEGSSNDIVQTTITPREEQKSIISGDKNKMLKCTFDSFTCDPKYQYIVEVKSSSNLFQSNNFLMNTRRCPYDTQYAYVVYYETKGGSNTYSQNTCQWKNTPPGKGPCMVYVEKDPGNDHVCASNNVDQGIISNIDTDRRC